MRTLAIVLGLAFAVVAIVYWLVPAGSLPSVFPGFEAGSPRVHLKPIFYSWRGSTCHKSLILFGAG